MRYKKQHDGDRVSPRMDQAYKMMCCDCGLVHRFRFEVVKLTKRLKKGHWLGKKVRGHKVVFTAYRDVRATAATRRRKRPSV